MEIKEKSQLKITIDSTDLDEVIEKANRLIELLREIQQITDSLFKER